MESSQKQATLGNIALNLIVTDLDGRKIDFGRATGRFFGKILFLLILVYGLAFTVATRGSFWKTTLLLISCAGFAMVGLTEKNRLYMT